MNVLAITTLLAVQQEGDGGGGITVILPALAELFWGAVAFAVFYWVMQRFAFPRINEMLENRSAAIQGKLEESEERLQEAERIRAEYREQLADAKNEANRIIEEAKATAESLRRDIVAKAESEAESIVQRAQAEVVAERERAVQQLRAEVGRLSVQLAGKIVEKELDEQAHRTLVDRYISRLTTGNGQAAAEPSRSGVMTAERPAGEGERPEEVGPGRPGRPDGGFPAPGGGFGGPPRTPGDEGDQRDDRDDRPGGFRP